MGEGLGDRLEAEVARIAELEPLASGMPGASSLSGPSAVSDSSTVPGASGGPESADSWFEENLRVLSLIAGIADPVGSGRDSDRSAGSPSGSVPNRIGPYEVLETLGEGGMGRVLLARQEEPVRRLVALKLIRPDRSTRTMQSRLESERQALALLTHPNIARLFEAGTTEEGDPWFAMEFVPGLPLTEWCEENQASLERRIELLATVCDAVQHAHYRGILHRDLKPNNVLVETIDGSPHPRVIDFGIARITTELGAERETLLTEAGQLLGTPEFMSPEQALGDPRKIDARTDVYALGTMLYELATGELPFEPSRLREAGLASITRILTSEDPPPPSSRFRARLRSDAEAAERSASSRSRSGASLLRSLRGELDWVVLRALEKDPEQRYASAAELGADLRRILRNEPVSAGPHSVRYRAQRFVRRHRTGVFAGIVASVFLLVGAATTAWQAVRARQAERVARLAEADAREQGNVTEAVNRILTGMLTGANPEEAPWTAGREPTVPELLDRAYLRLEFEDVPPAVEAEVFRTLADSWSVLGVFERADSSYARALRLDVEAVGAERRFELLYSAGRHALRVLDHDRAERLTRQASALAGEEWGGTSSRSMRATLQLAQVASRVGAFGLADSLFRTALSSEADLDRPPPPAGLDADRSGSEVEAWAIGLHQYGNLQSTLGRFESAEIAFGRSLEVIEGFRGRRSPQYGNGLGNLGRMLDRAGRYAESDSVFREGSLVLESTLGADHPSTATMQVNRASVLLHLDRSPEALVLLDQVEPILRRAYGDDHPNVARLLGHRGTAQQATGDLGGAIASYREALTISEKENDPGEVYGNLNNLASALRSSGEYAEAEPLFRQALALARELFGSDHFQVAVVGNNLARTLTDLRRYSEADESYREALRVADASFPQGHVNVDIMRGNHAYCLVRMGRADEAEPVLRAAGAALAAKLGVDHVRTRQIEDWLAEIDRGK